MNIGGPPISQPHFIPLPLNTHTPFLPQLRPQGIQKINARFLHSFLTLLEPKMCFFAALAKYMHTGRCTDTNDSIHAPLPGSISL